jgi:hypothetical protein
MRRHHLLRRRHGKLLEEKLLAIPGVNFLNPAFEKELIAKLKSYPNLILWISDHDHLYAVTPFIPTDPNHPENGFWQVETKSLREFPE